MSLATTEWVNKELDTFQTLVDDYAADIGYTSRAELQWLQEHMDDVLDTKYSLSTLLQTPGRLKGAPSPRKARLLARAPQSGPLSPKSLNSMNSGFYKGANKPSRHNSSMDSRMKDSWSNVPSTNPSATASTVTIFSDGSPDASFHSAEDVNERNTTDSIDSIDSTDNDTNTNSINKAEEPADVVMDTDIVMDTEEPQEEVPKVHALPIPPQAQSPESEFTFTSLPPREPLTAKTPGSDTVKPSATSLRVQRIRQTLEKSSGSKFSSMIIDGDDDFTKSAAIETTAAPVAAPVASAPIPPTRQLNSPIKLRNPHTGSPSKIGSLYPPISPSKSSSTTHNKENTHGHFFSGAIRRAKQLLFQDDKKENLLPHPQTPKQPSANISRLMAPTASSSARSPTRSPTRSPSKLYPEIRSPTKIPEPRQPASPTRIASPVRVASGASSIASLDIGTPRVLRQPSVKASASTNTRTSRVPVPKAGERFTRRQAKEKEEREAKEAKEKEEKEAKEKEAKEKEEREAARQELARQEAVAVAERERLRLLAAAEEQRRRAAAAEKKAQEELERKERAEKAQRARREQLIRERQERLEKEAKEREEREREEQKERERLERERLEHEQQLERERLEQEALLEEARLESLRLEEETRQEALRQEALRQQQEKENQLRQQQQSRKRSSSVAEDEQQQSQKVHLSNMRKPLSSSTRVSQNHRTSTSVMDSPLTKPTGGSLMRQSLQRQYKTGQMGQMAQSRFGKAVEGVMISNDTIKFGSSTTTTTTTSTTATAAAAAATASAGAATPLKRVGPNRPLHTTPQQFRTQRTGAFSSSMSFQAKLFKQPNASSSSTAPTPVASSMGSSLVADPMTPAASHVPVTQLPEINSDSEDDEGDGILRDWANSPELRSLLLRQQVMDPDRIFGPLPPLQMEEIFGNSNNARAAKFRGRSSSANWSRDQLSQFEIDSYSEQMGYK